MQWFDYGRSSRFYFILFILFAVTNASEAILFIHSNCKIGLLCMITAEGTFFFFNYYNWLLFFHYFFDLNLDVFDIRQNRLIDSFKPHTLNTKSLSMDMMEQFVVSGASDGNIKIWGLPTMTNHETWEDVHRKQTFVRPTGVFKSPVCIKYIHPTRIRIKVP